MPVEDLARAGRPPLLEEEGHASGEALIAQAAHPIGVHRAGRGATFPTRDEPIERGQPGREVHGPEQGLAAQEAQPGGDVEQDGDALLRQRLVLHGGAEPHVGVAAAPIRGQAALDAGGALGEHQPVEVGRAADEGPEPLQGSLGGLGVEHVRHGCAEHPRALAAPRRGPLPLQGPGPVLLPEGAAGRSLAPVPTPGAQVDALGIAVVATGADAGAAPPGIEGEGDELHGGPFSLGPAGGRGSRSRMAARPPC